MGVSCAGAGVPWGGEPGSRGAGGGVGTVLGVSGVVSASASDGVVLSVGVLGLQIQDLVFRG